MRRPLLLTTLLFLWLFILPQAGEADAGDEADSLSTPSPHVAVLPFVNYTGTKEAASTCAPIVEERLSRMSFRLVARDSLRQALRTYRIRNTGMIGADDARRLAQDFGLDYFVLGSFDLYTNDSIPEVAISVRLVEASSLQIVWAASRSKYGSAGILGLGKISSVDRLATLLVDDIFASLESSFGRGFTTVRSERTPLYAIVPFDNLTDNPSAGEIMTTFVAAILLNHGARLLEPGAAQEMFRRHNRHLRGEIDLTLLGLLHDSLGVGRVITGAVDRLQPAPPGVTTVTPEVQISGRLLNAANGKILASDDIVRRGNDGEMIFRLGVQYSLGTVGMEAAAKLWERLDAHAE